MLKKVLAAAVILTCGSASAATVYDKDGTSLAIGGRLQANYNSVFSDAEDNSYGNRCHRSATDADGNTILHAHYKNLMPKTKEVRGYALYVRDEEMKVNAPLSATGNHVALNPDMQDVLTTKMSLYTKMKAMCDKQTWTVRSWNETDTTVVSALVTNLSRKTSSQELLAEALYYQALRFPSFLVYKHRSFDGCIDDIFLNREYTIMFAHMLHHAGIPFQVAMTTMNNREEIDQLMDENNIVWMIRTNDGQCFIPKFDNVIPSDKGDVHAREIARQLVGRKARLMDGTGTFLVTSD